MTGFTNLLTKTCVPLIVIGSVWCLLAPSPTWAAEDQYKIPGWACKPSGLNGNPSSLHAKYHSTRGRIYSTHTSSKIKVVCPLHVKRTANGIKKVLVYYTNNNRQTTVNCSLHVKGKRGGGVKADTIESGESPLGPRQGFISITNTLRGNNERYFLQCSLPPRTRAGFSSIDNIHVYQSKPGNSSCRAPFCFDPGGVSVGSIMPGVACHPISENLRTQYFNDGFSGELWNRHASRPLQVVCPIVRDEMSTTKSPSISVEFENRNANSRRYRASCSLRVTSSTQGTTKQRMRWTSSDPQERFGYFKTTREFTIQPNDSFSVLCSIPPRGPLGKNSGIIAVRYKEK